MAVWGMQGAMERARAVAITRSRRFSSTLAASTAFFARDRGLPLVLQLLITPGTTAHADTASHRLFANGFLLDSANVEWFFDHYIDRHHRQDWHFAPLLAPGTPAPAATAAAGCAIGFFQSLL